MSRGWAVSPSSSVALKAIPSSSDGRAVNKTNGGYCWPELCEFDSLGNGYGP
jgi:hypothetical protein